VAVRTPPTGDSYTIDHSAVIYAYDRGNRLRLVIQPDFKLPELTADLRRLVAE
jgi:cytochrome oxidase Cu insertion factor (SCO1/SenC/PrrC family)